MPSSRSWWFVGILGVLLITASLVSAQQHRLSRSPGVLPGIASEPTCSSQPCVLADEAVSSDATAAYSLAMNPVNAQQMLTGSQDPNCANYSAASYSTNDGGATWTQTCLSNDARIKLFAPLFAYDRVGTAYAVALRDNEMIYIFKSFDNGATWQSPVSVVNNLLHFSVAPAAFVIDNDPASPSLGTLYVSATQFGNRQQSGISVSRSTDGGKTWTSTLVTVKSIPSLLYGDLAVAADGTLNVSWMDCLQYQTACPGTVANMLSSRSSDAGSTWSTPTIVAAVTLAPGKCYVYGGLPDGNCVGVDNNPVLAVDKSNGSFAGRLYSAMYNWTGTNLRLQVVHSDDGGNTWSAPVALVGASIPGDEFSAQISVNSSGLLAVTWLDRRNDPAHLKYRTFNAFSRDGGATFLQSRGIASALSFPSGFFVAVAPTLSAWNGNTLYSVWQDTRTGTSQVWFGGFEF